MRTSLLLLTFVFAGLILLSRPVSASTLCAMPDFFTAASDADVIFSGKITNVVRPQTSTPAAVEYVVTFKVETWWKGKPANETRVLWRSLEPYCPFLPVGQVGENYLVYADPSSSTTLREKYPEVTIFSRTARLLANVKSEFVLIDDWGKQTLISPTPELNRADASEDVKLLLALRRCGCLSPSDLPSPADSKPLTSIQDDSQGKRVSACRACLRRRLKPF